MFTKADKILIVFLILLSLASYPAIRLLSERGSILEIEVSGEEFMVVPLNVDREIVVPGRLGDSVILIEDGKARFISSPCPHKMCIKMGLVKDAGEMAACVPNGVLIRVLGKGDIETDFITR